MLFNHISKKLKLLPCILAITFSGYFAWFGYYGPRGYHRFQELKIEYQNMLKESKRIDQEKELIAMKVQNMYSNNIDQDLLDEMARKVLNFANNGDIIIFD